MSAPASAPERDGGRDLGGRVGEQVDAVVLAGLLVALLAALLQLAVGQHRAVVGRVAEVGVDLVVEHRAAAGAHRAGGVVARGRGLGVRSRPAQGLVAQRGQLDRDLVDGRRGDDEDAEGRQQRQQRHDDVRRLHQVEQQARGDVADRAPGLLEVGGVTEDGLRVAVGDVHDAEQAEGEGDPADDLAPGRAVALGVAHRAPPGVHEEERHEPADLADRAGGDRAGDVHDAAGQLPPHGRGGDRREPEEEEAGTVATVLGVEVAGRLPDRPGDRADGVGDAQPDGGDPPPERAEGPRDRTRAVAHGSGSRPGRGTSLGRAGAAPAPRRARSRGGALAGTP